VSFHPNEVARRARVASGIVGAALLFLFGAFFRTQIVRNQQWVLLSEENRLREIPLPAPRGLIFDRTGRVIAESVVGYTVSILAQSPESLRATLTRLSSIIAMPPAQIDLAIRRYRRAQARPTVIVADASFETISVLEEHRIEFPSLIIQSTPKRFYPDGAAVGSFVGYTGEIRETDLGSPAFATYKSGQQVGQQGLERRYESVLHGREGSRFVEVDSRGRLVRDVGAAPELSPKAGAPLQTNIDLDLQTFTAGLFGDSLQGAAVAIEPRTGGILTLFSGPSVDPNRFIGGIAQASYDSLLKNPRRPLYNKATQGAYPPGSTWKLATAIVALEENVAKMDDHMEKPCTGEYFFGNRYYKCWDPKGHGSLTLAGAIEKSCDVYFYQLGLKVGLSKLIAGGVRLGFGQRTGIDLPEENQPKFPDAVDYYVKRYGPSGFTQGGALMNLSIGQGENSQTVLNMARFYSALAEDGMAPTPEIAMNPPAQTRLFTLTPEQADQIRKALMGVVAEGGTAASAQIKGVIMAGKTGTAQSGVRRNGVELNQAWFAGFAPADDPKVVVVVMLEFGGHGTRAAQIASRIIEHYLKTPLTMRVLTDG
jgi:penicillin-binding protein 2